jgi:hypothetical protein
MAAPILGLAQIRSLMQDRGYSVTSRAADWSSIDYVKDFEDGYHVHARVVVVRQTIKLSAFHGLFTIESGDLSLSHPKFDTFETQLYTMLIRLMGR